MKAVNEISYEIIDLDRFNSHHSSFISARSGYFNLVDSQFADIAGFTSLFNGDLLKKWSTSANFKSEYGAKLSSYFDVGDILAKFALLSIGDSAKVKSDDYLKIGGDLFNLASQCENIYVFLSDIEQNLSNENLSDVILGIDLAAYKFDKYFVAKRKEQDISLAKVTFVTNKKAFVASFSAILEQVKAISAGVYFARDLVNEPANILDTTEFKDRILQLQDLGVKIDILEQKQLQDLGMGALLGVARGSRRPPYIVVMRWCGLDADCSEPLAFIGKGVVFDSGGISIKPAHNMEEMKGDMGGAAAVVGLMKSLALRKSKVNVVAAVGLVENMLDGDAQRPGDIVTSMSGQTIEIINTDAEGRLVLADVLHYVKDKYQPRFMIDLATLTGAVLVALGQSYAGLFSNDQKLADNLFACGQATGEKLWQLPLDKEYDKMIDSKFADMRNSTPVRYAGSITAAQFLQRFVGETAWAHLDIAGTASDMPKTSYSSSWGTGFGVRLLDHLVTKFYE